MPDPLSKAHRRAQLAIRAAAVRDVLRLFPAYDLRRISETWPPLERALLLVIEKYGRLSAGVAYAYYREARRAAGIPGSAPPMKATPTTAEKVAGLRAMAVRNAARQLGLGRDLSDVRAATLVNVTGVVSKYALDHGRDVIMNAVRADKYARGWERETGGGACDFCSMLAGRGAVYKTEESASFESHRHCGCSAVPAW